MPCAERCSAVTGAACACQAALALGTSPGVVDMGYTARCAPWLAAQQPLSAPPQACSGATCARTRARLGRGLTAAMLSQQDSYQPLTLAFQRLYMSGRGHWLMLGQE